MGLGKTMEQTDNVPDSVTVKVEPPVEGLAVFLVFGMARKNDFTYLVFLGPDGIAAVSGATLLESFDQKRNTFLMDYVDPRRAFTGRITARVLTSSELDRALTAFNMFRKYLVYPGGYETKLRAAISRGQDPKGYAVEVKAGGKPQNPPLAGNRAQA
jgi:hypothetical protein